MSRKRSRITKEEMSSILESRGDEGRNGSDTSFGSNSLLICETQVSDFSYHDMYV